MRNRPPHSPLHPYFGAVAALLFVTGLVQQLVAQQDGAVPSPVERIDELVENVWRDYDIRPSAAATAEEWCRRVHLDLIGRIPTVAELNEFLSSPKSSAREKLVWRLLQDDRYTEELARNWTTIWSNLLIGRTGGTANNSMINRAGLHKFLRDSFARNKPYDVLVRELITAAGTTVPGDEKFNGATNFLIDKVNTDRASQASAATSRLFLGLQIQCTQCHNHPFNDWKQEKYWEFNAFFRQARAFRGGMMPANNAPAELADQDFAGEGRPGNYDQPPVFYELRNGEMRVAYPVFVDGTAIDPSGYVKVVNRRQKLADLIVQSPWFSQAIVNRMWSHFLGYGFTTPVDDLGPHNPPTHPELLDFLAGQFRDVGFDLRQLMAWIVLSRPYALSSRFGRYNLSDDPQAGETPKFSRFYLRQMRAEELYESLLVATRAGQNSGDFEQQERLRNRWMQQFSQAFGTDEGDETTTFDGTIPQVLMMFNGDLIRSATGAEGNLIEQLLEDRSLDYSDQVGYLFQAGLARKPKKSELNMARQFLSVYRGNRREALRDIWWVILNCNEFIFNH